MTRGIIGVSAAVKMDGIYRRQRFIYDATRRYYLLSRDRLIDDLNVPYGGSVLEVGCGTARNLILAGRRYRQAKRYGLDVSEEMLRTARNSAERADMGERITLAAGDATAFNATKLFGAAHFDRVMISYALSIIPSWPDVVKNAASCLAPGGRLLIVDFGDFAQYPALLGRVQYGWLRQFSVKPIEGFEDKIKTLADEIGCCAATEKLYGGYAVLARIQSN
jgi:S-adenosylmethionine-diacylgycerolhomoserine-N-methlytransferase